MLKRKLKIMEHGQKAKKGCSIRKRNGAHTPEYVAYMSMMQRNYQPKNNAFKRYGGAGKSVDPVWHGPRGFENFLAYMGPRPVDAEASAKDGKTVYCSLHRIDDSPVYGPGTVKWATRLEQARSRVNNHRVEYAGFNFCIAEWSIILGTIRSTLLHRLASGWSVEKTLTTPVKGSKQWRLTGKTLSELVAESGLTSSTSSSPTCPPSREPLLTSTRVS